MLSVSDKLYLVRKLKEQGSDESYIDVFRDIDRDLTEREDQPAYRTGGQVSPQKAREILHHGSVRGHELTDKQRRFFGWLSSRQYGGQLQNTQDNDIPTMYYY